LETIRLRVEKKSRKGKIVTILDGFTRHQEEIKDLAREIKMNWGTGGTVKNKSIEIQGDFGKQVADFLKNKGFPVNGF
jgi:translation initiation factor 1